MIAYTCTILTSEELQKNRNHLAHSSQEDHPKEACPLSKVGLNECN